MLYLVLGVRVLELGLPVCQLLLQLAQLVVGGGGVSGGLRGPHSRKLLLDLV